MSMAILSFLHAVGLHTDLSFTCKCPPSQLFRWMCGPKVCSSQVSWRIPEYWSSGSMFESASQNHGEFRFNPPPYYRHLSCDREGTLDISHMGMDDRGQLTRGFVAPFRRKAEFCVCKPRYYGSICDKACIYSPFLQDFRVNCITSIFLV